jgi:hypothetical protein
LTASEDVSKDLILVTHFDCVTSEFYIHPNECVTLGKPVLHFADLENLEVDTIDLSEIDVAQLSIVDYALITFDAP